MMMDIRGGGTTFTLASGTGLVVAVTVGARWMGLIEIFKVAIRTNEHIAMQSTAKRQKREERED